jgi:Asp-tRNA(Asn)/Glu-tRNA(Gln) amidotransferase A subunit family amidase
MKSTVVETVEAALAAIQARDGELHAWKAVDREFALRQARALDAGPRRGPLHGMPVGVKDIFDTADLPTEYGSPIYKGHRPAADAACVAAARAAGAVILGKTVTTEFATMVPAATVHPKNPRHTPGGSSSGSAAAVAAGMVPFAYGMLSRTGMKMGAETLDTAGVIAKTVELAALLAGASAMRPLSIEGLDKPKLAVCRTPNWHHMSREGASAFENSLQELASRGARLAETEMPSDKLDEAASTILVYEMARGLAYEFANHRARVSPMLLERVEAGATMPHSKYAEALAYAGDCRARLKDSFKDVDAIVTPSATGEAPAGLGSTGNTAMNRLWTLLHGPCVTVPAGHGPGGLPLAVQIVGLPGVDAKTLAVARWVEHALA